MPRIHRITKDAALLVTTALPAAGATANGSSIDLGSDEPGPIVDDFDVLVEVPATPSLADTKNITITLQDSADDSTFAAIGALKAQVIGPAAGGAGGSALEFRCKLPATVRRYVRASYAVDASGGDNTAISGTLSLVF
jgi:hypothetical protein